MSKHGELSPLLKQSSGIKAVKGEGMYIHGDDGTRYLDFSAGIGVTCTGHCHPKVVEAAQKQVASLIHGQYTTVKHPNILELSEKLGELMPGDIDAMFYANAGTESVEAAMRLARQATGKPNMIVFHGGFHGRTMGSLSMTTSGLGPRSGVQPMMGGVVVSPFPDAHRYGWDEEAAAEFCLRELDHIFDTYSHPDESAAMLVEPIQGEAGYVPASATFMQGLRERCDRHDMLLIVDEIQAGFGRTGRFWSHEHFDVQPDAVITAKGLASGFPLSGFGANHKLMARGWPGSQGGTYGGNAVSCAAALATIEVIEEEGLVENARERGAQLRGLLEQVAGNHAGIAAVQGKGLMQGTPIIDADGHFDGDRAGKILAEAEKRGLLMIRCGTHKHIVRWLPALIVEARQIEEAVGIFEEALKATA